MANADFSYIVTNLSNFVANNGELLSSQVAYGTPTVKRVTPQNVKYKAKINFLSLTGGFQDGKGCATEYNSTAVLTDREIETAILERKWRICPDTLLGKYPEYLVRIPADKRDSLPFEAFLVSEIIIAVNDELETLVWQGDTDDSDLIDGYLTLASDDSSVIDVSISAGTSAYAAIKAVIAAIPAKLKRKSKVFVSPEFYSQLAFEAVDAKLPYVDSGESMMVGGIEVILTPGLAGADYIYASPVENMFYGSDDHDAQNRVKVGYNDEYGYFYVLVRFNAGVQHAFGDWIVLGAIGGDLVSPDANVALERIAASNEEIAEVMGDVFNESKNSINTTATA